MSKVEGHPYGYSKRNSPGYIYKQKQKNITAEKRTLVREKARKPKKS